MRILVLEDSTSRIEYFIERFSDHDLTITENADDAIVYLQTEVYDCIFLDNDLGIDNGCGTDVAAFLSSGMSINDDAIVIVHSWNMPAVAAILAQLPEAIAVQYGSPDFYGLDIDRRGS